MYGLDSKLYMSDRINACSSKCALKVSRCKQPTMPLDLPFSLRSKWFVYFACFLKFNATVVNGHAWIGEILLS